MKITASKHSFPIIEVEQLTIRRDGTKILREIDWKVLNGEHWVILGANGSGKTSLLNALTGYLMPSHGVIRVLGKTYGETDWREMRKKIGLVSASLVKMVESEETGLGIVASGREATINSWKISRRDSLEAEKILHRIGAPYLANRSWRILSQGERQRVLIARALMARPKLLILDEPCAGLDPVARESFLNFIENFAHQPGGPALVLVTHHVEEIMPSFSHLLLLQEGRVLAQGKIGETLQSRWLSQTFSAPVRVKKHGGRYSMIVDCKGRTNFIQD